MISDIFRAIFFPRRCLGCDTRETHMPLCPQCFTHVSLNESLFCGTCRARLPYGIKICHKNFPYILGAAGNYTDPLLRATIHSLKFRRDRESAQTLGTLLFIYASAMPITFSDFAIVPVPLSKRRERERGFNQSLLIARVFARHTQIPIIPNVLLRTRHTSQQSQAQNIDEREENVHGAFSINSHMAMPKNIILIDDVTTSGATLQEAARMLKSYGAQKILALTAAKA